MAWRRHRDLTDGATAGAARGFTPHAGCLYESRLRRKHQRRPKLSAQAFTDDDMLDNEVRAERARRAAVYADQVAHGQKIAYFPR